ncbi:hypothetical protein DFR76_12035 [Nocardia pseudobrasiliensis]|uniref:Uncharacterized protein n=1 Tax=Nocardia pseudobrasiliensis TaxID=45979 RepID=A0A370HKE3_9NOCA|nr:hypothetical protein DFR76_12035 [Nocardia pseudobrasiliensis]
MGKRGNRKVGEPRDHHIIVESEQRDPPDLRSLSRAILALAKQAQEPHKDS